MTYPSSTILNRLSTVLIVSATLVSCGSDEPQIDEAAQPGNSANVESQADVAPPAISQAPFAPGGNAPVHDQSKAMRTIMDDPEHIAAGRQLYLAMNCVGCHSHGGGGMGPPLIDNTWIYGGEIENIAASIREGRPAGMPSFRGFIPEQQIQQIAAYVRSLPGSVQQDN